MASVRLIFAERESLERKLTAILCTDVHSRMMGEDEEAAFTTVTLDGRRCCQIYSVNPLTGLGISVRIPIKRRDGATKALGHTKENETDNGLKENVCQIPSQRHDDIRVTPAGFVP